jgi:hypothetical protein
LSPLSHLFSHSPLWPYYSMAPMLLSSSPSILSLLLFLPCGCDPLGHTFWEQHL